MRSIDVCLSPELLRLYRLEEKVVVVADILRATSCIVTAISHGIDHVIPVEDEVVCRSMKAQGYLIAGEHNGEKMDGFDKGNSPFEYMGESIRGQRLAMRTTNGTVAIQKAKTAHQVLIGSFLNLNAIVNYLSTSDRDILVLCAGWKGHINIEDSLFAGAVFAELGDRIKIADDAALIAYKLYLEAKGDMNHFIQTSSHAQRLKRLHLERDMAFCLTPNQYDAVPRLQGERIVA